MDKHNVINITSNLANLEKDMIDWSNMPYDRRLRSDEDCIRLYNMTNIDLFNHIKAGILSRTLPENDQLIGNMVAEGTLFSDKVQLPDYTESEDEQSYKWKKQIVANLETSPNIVIINPFYNNYPDYSLEDLNKKYALFCNLNPDFKRYSNHYSLSIWGFNVPNMYKIMLDKLETLNDIDDNGVKISYDNSSKNTIPVIESVDSKIISDDKIGLLLAKLDSCNESIKVEDRVVYSEINKSIDSYIYGENTINYLPKVVPFFTPDEMDEFGCVNNAAEADPKEYYRLLKSAMESGNEDEIISLGWNPSVPLTEENFQFARKRQAKWLQERGARVIDIRNLKTVYSIEESTKQMRNMYKERGLYPVYIVLSFTNTPFGKIIAKVKDSTYTHAGLCLDSDLRDIYTFSFGKEYNGFTLDSMDKYMGEYKGALLDVLAIFVDLETKKKIETTIKEFISLKTKTRYGFGNVLNIFFNRAKEFPYPQNLHLVCSQFVDTVLKIANIDLVDKPTNLVIPQDFARISTNPKVFKIYEGLAKDYNEREAEGNIRNLFVTRQNAYIKYNDAIDLAVESSNFYSETENSKANSVLEELRDFTTPSVVIERKFPISFSDKGDLAISLVKSLEQEYQEAHKLLTGYNKENIEGIKHELARLFFINSTIEKKIKKMKKEDDSYKPLIDLRARVLNDFKKYFKIVAEVEPDFDFAEYFKKSEYYNGNIVIDNSVLRFTGELIKKFLRSQGV